MSLLLDQALVEDVAQYCPAQFLEYHKCLGGGDVTKCFEQQKQLSDCVTTNSCNVRTEANQRVPSFVKILKDCSDHMKAYEECIKSNLNNRTKCFDKLQEMRQCSAKSLNIPEGVPSR